MDGSGGALSSILQDLNGFPRLPLNGESVASNLHRGERSQPRNASTQHPLKTHVKMRRTVALRRSGDGSAFSRQDLPEA
jgi:hypothetical protein